VPSPACGGGCGSDETSAGASHPEPTFRIGDVPFGPTPRADVSGRFLRKVLFNFHGESRTRPLATASQALVMPSGIRISWALSMTASAIQYER
jgi:hypothetical protein